MPAPAAPIIAMIKKAAAKAAKKAANQEGISQGIGASKGLLKLTKANNITDAQAILINRAKATGKQALNRYIANQTGINLQELKVLMRNINQTAEMASIAKGKGFSELLNTKVMPAVRKDLKQRGINFARNQIKDTDIGTFERLITEYSTEERKHYNSEVKNKLEQIQRAMRERVQGIEQYNEYGKRIRIRVSIKSLYKPNQHTYTADTVERLESLLTQLFNDLEFYAEGDGESLAITGEKGGEWNIHGISTVWAWIKETKSDIQTILEV